MIDAVAMTRTLNKEQEKQLHQLFIHADIAHKATGKSPQKYFKEQRKNYSGKVKKLCSVIAKSPNAVQGLDVHFKSITEG